MRSKFIIYFLIIVGAFIVFMPTLQTIFTSFRPSEELYHLPITILPQHPHFKNYVEVFARLPFGRYLFNSFIVSVICVVVSLFVASLAGYGFAKYDFRGKNLFFFAIVSMLMIPFQVLAVPLYCLVSKLNLIDTYPGIILPQVVSAFGVFLMRESIEDIPDDYIDAARIDGCSNLGIYWHIILPNVKSGLATLAIIKFMWTWKEFFWPLIVTTSDSVKVATIGLAEFTNMHYIEYHLACAATIVTMIPLVVMFIFFNKWVVAAMIRTGIK